MPSTPPRRSALRAIVRAFNTNKTSWVGLGTVVGVPAPILSRMVEVTQAALSDAAVQRRLVELTMLQFDSSDAGEPPEDSSVIARFEGEAVGGSATLTRITMLVGSVLAPIGSQIPPRTITTNLIGKGCIL